MPERHLRRRHVEELTGLARSTIYGMMSRGEFPRPIQLTAKAVAWPESTIVDWLSSRCRSTGDRGKPLSKGAVRRAG